MLKKAVIIPDSFKGTISSQRICELMSQIVERVFPVCELRAIPGADGGEGSVDAALASVGGERVGAEVRSPQSARGTA